MKIKELEDILRQYNDDTEIVFGGFDQGNHEYELELDNARHHADSDTLLIEFSIK